MPDDTYVMPPLYVNCPVLIWNTTTKSEVPLLGMVTRVKPNAKSADIRTFVDGQPIQKMDCWHTSDPRCKASPEIIDADFERGVFAITVDELEKRELIQKLGGLERVLEDVLARLAKLETKKKPGRPPKSDPPSQFSETPELAEV